MCSPVLYRMMCGGFSESSRWMKIKLQDVNAAAFVQVLDIWCGYEICAEMELKDVKELVSVADRFQINDVISSLEASILGKLTLNLCADVMTWSSELGLRQLEAAARELATERFEQLVKTDSFTDIDEQALEGLLEDDHLSVRNEEAVWEAVAVWWRAGKSGQMRARELVRMVRFPLMAEEYLRDSVVNMAPAEDAGWIEGVVAEALQAKSARAKGTSFEFRLLGPRALDDRAGKKILLEGSANGGDVRLREHTRIVLAIAQCGAGRVCSGSMDGSINVWRMTGTREAPQGPERRLAPEGGVDPVHSLSVWEGRLISGHGSGKLRVWDVDTGTCEYAFSGHCKPVNALAVFGSRVVSGFHARCAGIKVWALAMDENETRILSHRTVMVLQGHSDVVWTLVGWQGKILSGSEDKSIRVWDADTGAHDATLTGHSSGIQRLATHPGRGLLFSASLDGTVRVWALGAWEAVQVVRMSGPRQRVWCLAVSGPQLICGMRGADSPSLSLVVWDVASLEAGRVDPKVVLPQPPSEYIPALLATEGRVWAAVGSDVLVWGSGPGPSEV